MEDHEGDPFSVVGGGNPPGFLRMGKKGERYDELRSAGKMGNWECRQHVLRLSASLSSPSRKRNSGAIGGSQLANTQRCVSST